VGVWIQLSRVFFSILNFLEKPEIEFVLLPKALFYCHVMMVQKTKVKSTQSEEKATAMKLCGMGVSRGHIQFTCRLFNWKERKKQKQISTSEAAVTPDPETIKIQFTCRSSSFKEGKQKTACEAKVSQNNSQIINPKIKI